MPRDDLRSRIEALNRQPLSNLPPEEPEPPAEAVVSAREPAAADAAAPQSLDQALPGTVCSAPDGGSYYCIERPLAEHAVWAENLGHQVRAALVSEALCDKLRHPTGVPAENALFLDVETLGLNTEPIFLVGMLAPQPTGALVCRQLLARSLAEEAAILSAFAEALCHARALVTFNGVDFDLRLLRYRAAAHGIRLSEPRAHLDVLLEARKRFKYRLPNCRLQTLEERLCGRLRVGDVPGAQIPGIYEEFTRTGDAAMLAVVLHHNLLDLATTADLLARFWAAQ